jgi:hypothetical protein
MVVISRRQQAVTAAASVTETVVEPDGLDGE